MFTGRLQYPHVDKTTKPKSSQNKSRTFQKRVLWLFLNEKSHAEQM